jgi:hypothetical protein
LPTPPFICLYWTLQSRDLVLKQVTSTNTFGEKKMLQLLLSYNIYF